MNSPKFLRLTLLVSALSAPAFGQQFLPDAPTPDLALPAAPASAASKPAASVSTSRPVATAPALPPWERTFDRWVDLKEATFALRYRSVMDSNNAHEFNQGQNRSILDGKFKFDEQGRYGVSFHASTGHYFNWAYADFIGGGNKQAYDKEYAKENPAQQFVFTLIANQIDPQGVLDSYASGGWAFYVRRLSLDLEPLKGIQVQYGSMDLNRGSASEITTYDNDGYLAGERLSIKRPKLFFLDEISSTLGYVGDIYKPNFFARGARLAHPNYHQYLIRKQIKNRVDTSFHYEVQDGYRSFHQGGAVRVSESRVLDSVRVEFYQRLANVGSPTKFFGPGSPSVSGHGYGVTLNKKVAKRFSTDAGVSSVDWNYVYITVASIAAVYDLGVNGDQYGLGQRFFVRPSLKLTPYLEATGYYTHTYTQPPAGGFATIWNKQALNAGLVFDMKKAFFHEKQIK